jgi:restriction endonuclease Mrr
MPLAEFPGVKTPPRYEAEFLRFMNPLLDVMREKGGQARPREIYEAIAQKLNLSEEERTVTNKNGYPRSYASPHFLAGPAA